MTETIEVLRTLLREAESGHLIGLAFAAIYKDRRYIVDTAGEAYRSPTFARGMVAALDDESRELLRQRMRS